MKKSLLAISLVFFLTICLRAQEKSPLINSGEIIQKAIQLHDEGKYKGAIDLYQKISRNDTNYIWALYEMALSYSLDSQAHKAIATSELALVNIAMAPNREPEILTSYASSLDDVGESERALRIYDSVIQKYPAYSSSYLNKGTTLLRLKKYKEAEAIFKECLLIDPYSYSSHYNLGLAALNSGKLIPAMLSFINYLLVTPEGRYSRNAIQLLGAICSYKESIETVVNSRTEDTAEEFKLAEEIIRSKIALDKNYKPIIKLDDPISRQIQVLFEKLEYNEESNDFWMQYYVPFNKEIFSTDKFELFINHIFSGVNIAEIKTFNKKNEKQLKELLGNAALYLNAIRNSREINLSKRKNAKEIYFFEGNNLSGKGKMDAKKENLIGQCEFYYPAGNIKTKGQYIENAKRQGQWIYYYFNGTERAKETYNNSVQNGEAIFYYPNGLISSKSTYVNDNKEGESISYYYTGVTRFIETYKNGKLNGALKKFYSNGNLQSIENYVNDKAEGNFKTFYKNGSIESEGTFKTGTVTGPYKTWHQNGKLLYEGNYNNDKPEGVQKRYYENGKLKSQENYADGITEGEYLEYHENGQELTRYNNKKGKTNGEVQFYDEDGKRFSSLLFDNNLIKSAKYFDKSGKQINISEAKGKKIDLVIYRPDGTKRSEVKYDEKGEKTGTEINYYYSGKVSQKSQYANNNLDGNSIAYFINGQPSSNMAYANGMKDGYFTSYYPHGGIESEGWYKNNLAQGKWLNYDEKENLTAINNFANEELDGFKEELYVNGKKEYETKYHMGWIEEMVQYDTTGKEINRLKMNQGSGKYTGLHLTGKIRFEGNYVKGDFDGPYKFYYFDGTLENIQYYKKGLADSVYRDYYYGGKIYTEGQYKMGQKTGTWKYYRKKGTVSFTEEYADGKLNGKKVYFYENGKPDLESFYKDDEREGWAKKYDPTGNLAYQVYYKAGVQMYYSYLDKSGTPVPNILLQSGNGKVKTFYSNGNVAADFEYADGKINGTDKMYHSNGKLWYETNEVYGSSEGEHKMYYSNGQLQSVYNYLHNRADGPFKEYAENGKLLSEGNYYNNNYHGNILYYDAATGKLSETYIYYYGKLLNIKK